MQTLLVPLDTSSSSPKVLDHAASLASRISARVVLLHVLEPVASYVPVGAAMDVMTTTPPEIEPEQTQGALKRLEQLAAPLRARGIEVACESVVGLAVDEILDLARRLPADLIILGSHGHGALYHLFSGSVVTGVLKHSPCPVTVVPVRT